MKIGPLDNGDRPNGPEEAKRQKANLGKDKPQTKKHKDSIHISDDGKRLSESTRLTIFTQTSPISAAETGASESNSGANGASKVEQARQRLELGFFQRPEIIEKIAGRLTDKILD